MEEMHCDVSMTGAMKQSKARGKERAPGRGLCEPPRASKGLPEEEESEQRPRWWEGADPGGASSKCKGPGTQRVEKSKEEAWREQSERNGGGDEVYS